MGTIAAFLGTYLLSLFVAALAALQLADFFRASEEFILVLMALPVFALVSIVAFAVASRTAAHASVFVWVAVALTSAAVLLVLLPSLAERMARRSTNPYTVGIENLYITLELLVPAFLLVLVQWGLVRRRWLSRRGDEDLTLWPWITTAVGGLAILNPYGLEIIAAALNTSPGNILRQLWIAMTLGAAAILLVMTLIEVAVRRRMLRRRLAPIRPPSAPAMSS